MAARSALTELQRTHAFPQDHRLSKVYAYTMMVVVNVYTVYLSEFFCPVQFGCLGAFAFSHR